MHTWQTLSSALSDVGTVLLLVSLALAVKRLFRYCRHKRMGWPIWLGGSSYRVCMDCGIKRLFDERTLREYGPYSYHINELLGRQG